MESTQVMIDQNFQNPLIDQSATLNFTAGMSQLYYDNINNNSKICEETQNLYSENPNYNGISQHSIQYEVNKFVLEEHGTHLNYGSIFSQFQKPQQEKGDRFIHNRQGTHTEVSKFILKGEMGGQKGKQGGYQGNNFMMNLQLNRNFSNNSNGSSGSELQNSQPSSTFFNNNNNNDINSIFEQQQYRSTQQNTGDMTPTQVNEQSEVNNNNNSIFNQSASRSVVSNEGNKKYLEVLQKAIIGTNSNNNSNNITCDGNIFEKSTKITSYNPKKNSIRENDHSKQENFAQQLSKLFTNNTQTQKNKPKYRYISPTPEKILDAPDLKDDYYLNLMDWGDNGILAVSLFKSVYLWNSYTGDIQLLLTANDNTYVSSVEWMKQRDCLAVGFSNKTIQLWDTQKFIPYRNLNGHDCRVSSLSWNNYILSSGSRDNKIINHDVRVQNNIVSVYQGHDQEVCGLKWNYSGTKLASGSNDNKLLVWDFSKNSIQHSFQSHTAAVKAIAWCPWQSDLLASGGGTSDKCIKFWDTLNGEMVKSVYTDSQVCSLLWNPHEREIVSSHGFSKNQLIVWKYDGMEKMAELQGHQGRVMHMSLNPDKTTICSAASDETLRFWKVFDKVESSHKITKDYYDTLSIYSGDYQTSLR